MSSSKISKSEIKRLRDEPESLEVYLITKLRKVEAELEKTQDELRNVKLFSQRLTKYSEGLYRFASVGGYPICNGCGDFMCSDEHSICKKCKKALCPDCKDKCTCWRDKHTRCNWYGCKIPAVYNNLCVFHKELPFTERYWGQSGIMRVPPHIVARKWTVERHNNFFDEKFRDFIVFLWWCFKKELKLSKDITCCLIAAVVAEWQKINKKMTGFFT